MTRPLVPMGIWNPFAPSWDSSITDSTISRNALAAGVRADLSEAERRQKYSGHSLRAGLATAAAVDERYTQKQSDHASPTMTRCYQPRTQRFRVNITKAAGL
jgi:integrase